MIDAALSFTKLVVNDLSVAEAFYCNVFELEPIRGVGTDEHKFALDEVILSKDGQTHPLILTRYRDLPCPPAGSAWTGFVVDSIEAAISSVVVNGGTIEVPTHRNPDHNLLAAIAADPDGHLIEIIQVLRV